jgi:hypothetical protein
LNIRTGRYFFTHSALERAFLDHAQQAISTTGLGKELETDWLSLTCEFMPWSAKARKLLRPQ